MPTLQPGLAQEHLKLPVGFESWSREQALAEAKKLGVEMTDAHWEVVYFLREHCKTHGAACSARKVIQALSRHFKQQGGKRYLYRLFPHGPIYQACKIAGLPLPPSTLDLSFGSVH